MAFQDLAKATGIPSEEWFATPHNPADHHAGKAIWINESGFYKVLLSSSKHKERCVTFQSWVCGTVLPSIRRTGSYGVGSVEQLEVTILPVFALPAKKALAEPVLDWIQDLGARRSELPAAKAQLRLLLEIELAAGALPRATAPAKIAKSPPVRLRSFADAALASVRDAVERRLAPLAAGHPSVKRPRSDDVAEEEDEDILTVSEVMTAAQVWGPVKKSFMSDLSNRMLQLKCVETSGDFSERREQDLAFVTVLVHKYKKPEDVPIARQALADTRMLYEKRIRELLEEAFIKAGNCDGTIARACSDAARLMAVQLSTDIAV
jgi:prophage antirepressor-like protein